MNETSLGLDDELTLRAEYCEAEDSLNPSDISIGWHINHECVWDDECADMVDGCGPTFARESDVLRAIAALKAAGFTTARKLWFEREERNRIIGEAMAW